MTDVKVSAPSAGTLDLLASLDYPSGQLLAAEGAINRSWTFLDYMLRLALKRLMGLHMQAPINETEKQSVHDIFAKYTHGNLCEKILAETSTRHPALTSPVTSIITKIGGNKLGGGLYSRRNDVIHSIIYNSATGTLISQRIGAASWLAVSPPPTEPEIRNLIQEILTAAAELDTITKPLL